MRLRLVWVLTLCVVAAGCATPARNFHGASIHPPGGPVPADFSLCDLNPAPSACNLPDTELTAAKARERIDAEYARLREVEPDMSARFAVGVLHAAKFSSMTSDYIALRDRALKSASEGSEENGLRYFMLDDIGKAAFEAGDRETARRTIEQRHTLLRRRRDDHEWKNWEGGDVIFTLPRKDSWRFTAFDAARFGEADLAISVLNGIVPESERDSLDYLIDIAEIRLLAGQFEQAEPLARKLVETAPSRFDEKREM